MDLLLNWLWQACAVTVIASVTLRLCHGLSATTRYQVWWTTLVLVLALPALPSWLMAVIPAGDEANTELAVFHGVTLPPRLHWPLTTLVIIWSVWISVMLLRAVMAVARVRRLKHACVSFPAERETRLCHWMSIRTLGRRVRLVVSDEIRCAAAIGLVSPVIAVAPVVLRELDDDELDRILVHEWAHIQRRDDIARLFQVFVGVLAGFNPAMWWIDRQLEIEREVACDDRVIEITGARTAYAASLTKLAAVPTRPLDLALVSGALSAPQLTTRILRLLDDRRNASTRRSLVALALAAPGLLVLALTVASMQPVVLATPGLRPLPAPDGISSPPSASTVTERGAPIIDIDQASRSIRESSTPRQLQQQSSVTRVSAGSGSAVSISGAERRLPVQLVSTRPAASIPDVERSTSPAEPPITTDVTPSTLVSLPEQPVSLPAPGMHSVTSAPETAVSPWAAAANAGAAMGRTSQQAATRTAGFFTRLSKNIAGAF